MCRGVGKWLTVWRWSGCGARLVGQLVVAFCRLGLVVLTLRSTASLFLCVRSKSIMSNFLPNLFARRVETQRPRLTVPPSESCSRNLPERALGPSRTQQRGLVPVRRESALRTGWALRVAGSQAGCRVKDAATVSGDACTQAVYVVVTDTRRPAGANSASSASARRALNPLPGRITYLAREKQTVVQVKKLHSLVRGS